MFGILKNCLNLKKVFGISKKLFLYGFRNMFGIIKFIQLLKHILHFQKESDLKIVHNFPEVFLKKSINV